MKRYFYRYLWSSLIVCFHRMDSRGEWTALGRESGGGWNVADVRDVAHGCATFLC